MPELDPTVRGEELGAELRRLRESAGLSLNDAAATIDASASKLSRIENAKIGVVPTDVAGLLATYGVRGKERSDLLDLAHSVEKRGWLRPHNTPFEAQMRTLHNLESRAAAITRVEVTFVPGLLQTIEYMYAVMRPAGVIDEKEVESRVVTRLGRQSVLRRPNAPNFLAIIDETVLQRQIGGPDVMRAQLRYLIEAANRPNIVIRIIPASVPVHLGLDGAFTRFHFVDREGVVYLENRTTVVLLEEKEETGYYDWLVRSLLTVALNAEESKALLAILVD
ncbi:helix-turn-helix domain-containing protein [Solihabitans fulvus]|uniref:Helix-turn-helix domain-containing protein n=1 Tax=Solihabitans fulvus TaxID=1892852 RepID=A0A5B2X6B2_9PSEU|nr:helix-turn-helix transcriptional regulator [Solihabitans fulvus]KAA2258760.1 helix-turn-helix domain-containing protein [Solihabitans fulvus]